jgi:hypothetical protein
MSNKHGQAPGLVNRIFDDAALMDNPYSSNFRAWSDGLQARTVGLEALTAITIGVVLWNDCLRRAGTAQYRAGRDRGRNTYCTHAFSTVICMVFRFGSHAGSTGAQPVSQRARRIIVLVLSPVLPTSLLNLLSATDGRMR